MAVKTRVESDGVGNGRRFPLDAADDEGPAVRALREKEGHAFQGKGVGDEVQERLGELVQASLPAELLADDEERLPELVRAPVKKPVEEGGDQLFQRGEERRPQDHRQYPQDKDVELVLGKGRGPGAEDDV